MATFLYSDAVISPCKKFRYVLRRHWSPMGNKVALFVMLNPSTADALADDPTIRKCCAFAKSFGMDGIVVVNLFAYRATNPKELIGREETAVGAENDAHVAEQAALATRIICAWGKHKSTPWRSGRTMEILRAAAPGRDIECLGTNSDGSPKHPLYLKGTTVPQIFTDAARVHPQQGSKESTNG